MSEFRQDRTTGRWVIIAPERMGRPNSGSFDERAAMTAARDPDPDCPFCPGNEHLLPRIIEEMPDEEPPGWLTRVVPNKYPAVTSEKEQAFERAGTGGTLPGCGFHEVIVETPNHDADLAGLSERRLAAVIATYRDRYAKLLMRPRIESVMIFRNHGRAGGASLQHPHSQLVATPVVPPYLAEMAAWAEARRREHGHCVTCEAISHELDDGQRVVEATDRFAALVPFAAACPFELWILPRRHQASFADLADGDIPDFAALLGRCLRRIERALDNPAYTYAIQSAPAEHANAPYFHWRLRLLPNVVTPGGFEIGGGLPINPASPEADAETLRSTDPDGRR